MVLIMRSIKLKYQELSKSLLGLWGVWFRADSLLMAGLEGPAGGILTGSRGCSRAAGSGILFRESNLYGSGLSA